MRWEGGGRVHVGVVLAVYEGSPFPVYVQERDRDCGCVRSVFVAWEQVLDPLKG